MFGSPNPDQSVVGLADILTLDDRSFVRGVKHILAPGPEPMWAMSAVAYQNLETFKQAVSGFAQEFPDPDVPTDLDGLIRFLGKNMLKATNEIGRRRLAWFFHAALIRRATEIASRNPSLREEVAGIWIMLARGSGYLNEVLPHNMLWSDEEKAYFDGIKNQRDGIQYCLQILAPAYLREGNHLLAFAQSHDIVLLPE